MAEQISFNALRAFDADGLPAGGAKAFFYETGTTTPVTVYAESALTTPLASPHVADADGFFAQVFSDGAVQIKCVMKSAGDVVLNTIDPVIVSFTSSAATSVTFTPTAEIAQTNVQAAIEQVQDNSTTDIAAAIAAIPAIPIATQIEAETGTDNTARMTPLRTAQAIVAQTVFSQEYTSAEQTLGTATLITLAHGLGVIPSFLQYRLVCQTAENGYSIGDIIDPLPSQGGNPNATTALQVGLGVKIDATNITARCSSSGATFMGNNATTGASVGLSDANWKLVVKAWA